jgi:Holliday junction resolvase
MTYARIDTNHREIVNALRKLGATVVSLASMKHGCPDLLVGFQGETMLMEIKKDEKAKFTPDQLEFMAKWRGGPISRVDSVDAAIRALGLIQVKHPKTNGHDIF